MDNSVFISYRRDVSAPTARAVFQDLWANGIDAFLDVESIGSGRFDTRILREIATRPYFLLILTPGTLDRCTEPDDWLVREMEQALVSRRKFIPLETRNFDQDDFSRYLTGRLAAELPYLQRTKLDYDLFSECMIRLRAKILIPTDLPTTPVSREDEPALRQKMAQAAAGIHVTVRQLSAQEYFERALTRIDSDQDGKIADLTESIRLSPQQPSAYYNRGLIRQAKGDLDGALADYNEAIRLYPLYVFAYNNRGAVRQAKGDLDGALADYNEAIRINPLYALAYIGRAAIRKIKGDLDGTLADCNEAIRLNPQYAPAYNNRGAFYNEQGDWNSAIADCNEAIRLEPLSVFAYVTRGNAYYASDNWDRAFADYDEAIRLDPQCALAYHGRGNVRRDKGDIRGALADFEHVLRIEPDYFQALFIRGQIEKLRKRE